MVPSECGGDRRVDLMASRNRPINYGFTLEERRIIQGVFFAAHVFDEALVGTSDMSTTLSAGEAKVQPYFNVSKIDTGTQTGTGTMLIDYVRCYQSRA